MKTLIFNEEEFEAEKIIKTETNIIGKDILGKVLFEFKGISDFSMFILKDGQAFDQPEPTISELQSQIFNLTSQLINGGAL